MTVEEMLALLREPPEDGLPETIYDDLHATYNDASGRAEAGDAKVAELSEALAAKDAEISQLKAHNYDLIMSLEGATVEHAADTTDDDEPNPTTYDDLYGSDKDDD